MLTRLLRALLVAMLGTVTFVVAASSVASAGSGLNQYTWAGPGLTVSNASYRYSNMSGFVQALVNSNRCTVAVDGNFGSYTTWYLSVMQNGILGYNNGGLMTPSMWNDIQFASSSTFGPRLINEGVADGYGTGYYSYYGGGSIEAKLGWNPFSSQWLFSPTPLSNRASLYAASPSRTIGSTAACA